MGRCIDRSLRVDAGRTRDLLGWTPTARLEIVRRLPFLIQNMKTYPAEWLLHNHVAAHRVRLRHSARIHDLLSAHEGAICLRIREQLEDPDRRSRFAAYLDCPVAALDERHHLLPRQLMCAVRTGDKAVFMNCCRHLAERWYGSGLPLKELSEALDSLCEVCRLEPGSDPRAVGLGQTLHDQITMTFRFAIDAVQEVQERLSAAESAPPQP